MTRISRLTLIAVVATAGMASPAFAQPFDPEARTGNVLSFSYAPTVVGNDKIAIHRTGHGRIAARHSGLHAFDMVPGGIGGTPSGANANDPALTGGGSVGYNQMLLQY